MRSPWLAVGSLVTVVALGSTTYNFVSLVAHEEVTQTVRLAAASVEMVDLRNETGSVEVVGGDVEEITVESHVSHGLRRTRTKVEVRDGVLILRGDCPIGVSVWCSVDYRLVVPKGLPIAVRNDNGRVRVSDLDGDVTAASSNGSITATRIGGDLDANTANGRIVGRGLRGDVADANTANGSIELSFVEAPQSVRARTANGSVEVVVPDDATTYRVDIDTRLGSTDAAVRVDPGSDHKISAHTTNGSVTVRYPTE